MRRDDYACDERREIEAVLAEIGHGYLGVTTPDGWPSVVPLNFVYLDERVYFHGAHEGEKMASIALHPRVTFTVVDAAALIPSYWRHPRSACPATQYYRSVMIRGRARFVDDAREKAHALQAMMEKLQPEGGHVPITATSDVYQKALRNTAVTAIEVERMTGKFKFGQNLSGKKREEVLHGLRERNDPLDDLTVRRMLQFRPDRPESDAVGQTSSEDSPSAR